MQKPVKRKKKTVEEWDAEYTKLITHALNRYGDSTKVAREIKEFLGRRWKDTFNYVNPHSRKLLRQNLRGSVAEQWGCIRKNHFGVALVTFIDRSWVCNDKTINTDYDKLKQKVRNALAGASFIACVELAFYVDKKIKKRGVMGKLICVHVHAIAWDSSYRQLERRRQRIAKRFTRVFRGNSSPVRLSKRRSLGDLMDTLDYMSKMNVLGYRANPGNGKQQGSGKLSLKNHYELFQALSKESLFDFWFSGGQGVTILRNAKNACLGKRKEYTAADIQDAVADDYAYDCEEYLRKQRRKERKLPALGGGLYR